VGNAVPHLAVVAWTALLGRSQDHRLQAKPLLKDRDAAAPVAIATGHRERMVEDVEDLHADSS
jgi:hypothetical protein